MTPADVTGPEEVIATYDRVGLAFDRTRDRTLFERPWLDRALMLAPRAVGRRRVLDLGCGGGRPIATYLTERSCIVTGVDGARSLIELFARTLPGAEALHADMRGLRLGREFDLLIAWDSFFHLQADDQQAMFATFAAHAAPGAVLLFTSGPHAGTAIGEVAGEPVFHESLSPDTYRAIMADAGFDEVGYWPEEPACAGHTVWMARRRRVGDASTDAIKPP